MCDHILSKICHWLVCLMETCLKGNKSMKQPTVFIPSLYLLLQKLMYIFFPFVLTVITYCSQEILSHHLPHMCFNSSSSVIVVSASRLLSFHLVSALRLIYTCNFGREWKKWKKLGLGNF